MKIAIVTDKSRVNFLPGKEGLQEDKQHKDTMMQIKDALSDEYDVINLVMDHDIIKNIRQEKVDLVFNLCNGVRGEASLSQLPAVLESEGIPYTSSTPLAHGLAYNKIISGKIFKASQVPTPRFNYVKSIEELEDISLDYPLLVKPKDEGSSRGIHNDSLVFDKESLKKKVQEELDKYNPPIMIMEFIDGREFTVGILGSGKDIQVLPILEIDFSGLPEGINKIYSFEAKFEYDKYVKYHIPARVDSDIYNDISETAIKAFKSLGLRDYARVDIRLKNNIPYVIEVNSLPGLDKNSSDICKMAAYVGISYEDLIKRIVKMGLSRVDKLNKNLPIAQ